ncbi:MAG: hypothetical protein ACFFG0_22200, partial [Candidatus Thorarchaeota archaeon]
KDINKLVDIGSKYKIQHMMFCLPFMYTSKSRDNQIFSPLTKKQLKELYFKIYPKLLRKAINKDVLVDIDPLFSSLVNKPKSKVIETLSSANSQFDEEIENYSKQLYGKKFYRDNECYKRYFDMCINTDGKIHSCWPSMYFGNPIGNIFKDDILKILTHRKILRKKHVRLIKRHVKNVGTSLILINN